MRTRFPACICEPDLDVPSPKHLEILPYSRLSDLCRTGVGHRRWVREDTPALRPQTEPRPPSSPASAVPAFPNSRHLLQRALPAHSRPAEPAKPGGRIRGGAGGIISDLAVSRRTRSPVCTRHTVQAAELVRRALRLTAGVNPAYFMPVGRAPDVARGPSALKNGLPAAPPPFALCFGHNLPVHPVLLKQL